MNTALIANSDARPPDLLATRTLVSRPARAPNLESELTAFREITEVLVDDPSEAPQRILDVVLGLCRAGTAGLSVLRPGRDDQAALHWDAISGALAPHKGAEAPSGSSMCGLCLDAGAPILVSRPGRAFQYLSEMRPSIIESLIVPLNDGARRAFGTLWLAHHDATSRFCSTDVRIAQQLAPQMVLALRQLAQAREHRTAIASLESHRVLRQNAAHELVEQCNGRELAEASEIALRRTLLLKEAVIKEVHHRVRNNIQIAASVLALHARATALADVRVALQESDRRLHVLAKVHELLYSSAESKQEILMPALLQAIGEALRLAFAEAAGRVSLRITCDALILSPHQAVPMALLANEAVTNAYKYAFPGSASGEITVDLTCPPEGEVILRIGDDGIGLRPNRSASGLGLKLIGGFAAQLQGALTFTSQLNGTGTVITVAIHPEVDSSA